MDMPTGQMTLSNRDRTRLNDLLRPIDRELLDLDRERRNLTTGMFARFSTRSSVDHRFDAQRDILARMQVLHIQGLKIVTEFVPNDPMIDLLAAQIEGV